MSKIPDDIMRMAIDLALDPKTPAVPTNSFPGACAIAAAVLDERERCAKVAHAMVGHSAVADKIRSGE